jgi:hypothetical protein
MILSKTSCVCRTLCMAAFQLAAGSAGSVPLRRVPWNVYAYSALKVYFRTQWSGRTMARTGLRMMRTFPSSPLKFRTAGFPQCGFKAGVSAGTFPRKAATCRALPVCVPPPTAASVAFSAQCRSTLCAQAPPFKRLRRSTPGGLAPVRVLLSRSIHTYAAPFDRLAGTARFRCLAAYTPCLRCTFPPRRPATGSALSPLILRLRGVRRLHTPSSLHRRRWPSSLQYGLGTPVLPTNPFHVGAPFEASLRFARATTCCFVHPPDGSDRISILPSRIFTTGLPTVWSLTPSPVIATVATG